MSWQSFLFLQSLIITISLGIFINKFSVNPYLSVLLYFTFGLFSVNISGGRQSLSLAIVLIGVCKLYDKKYWWFLISVAIAFFLHYSAVISLLLLVLPILEYRRDKQLLFWLLLPLIVRLLGNFIILPLFNYVPGRYIHYFEEDSHQMSLIKEVFIVGILLFCYFGLKFKKKEITSFDCLSMFVACEELSFSVYMAARLAYYFESAFIILVPSVINKYPNMRLLLTTTIVFVFITAFFVITKGTPYENYYFFYMR